MSDPAEGVQAPAWFVWRGERYEVTEVLSTRMEAGFGAGEVTRTWYRRRHRNYWRVRASDGKVYELYLDRGSGRRIWTLGRCLSPAARRGE